MSTHTTLDPSTFGTRAAALGFAHVQSTSSSDVYRRDDDWLSIDLPTDPDCFTALEVGLDFRPTPDEAEVLALVPSRVGG